MPRSRFPGRAAPVDPRRTAPLLVGTLPLVLVSVLPLACGPLTPPRGAEGGPYHDRDELVVEMTWTWALNVEESETWELAYERLVKERGQLLVQVPRPTDEAKRGVLRILGVSPRVRVALTDSAVTLHPVGLDPLRVTLDGESRGTDRAGWFTVSGGWVVDGFRVERVLDVGTSLVEEWVLAPTGDRIVVHRTVTYPGTPQVTYVQVWDRLREGLGTP